MDQSVDGCLRFGHHCISVRNALCDCCATCLMTLDECHMWSGESKSVHSYIKHFIKNVDEYMSNNKKKN